MHSTATPTFHYRRHEPEASLLYRVFAAEWESWTAERGADDSRSPLPAFVAKEVEAFFRCGILDHGFVLLSCDACGDHRPVAFSGKRRGICPSCCAKRMSEIASHLIDDVLPPAPYRQWVTTFPHALRYWLAASRKLTSIVHRRVSAMIQLFYIHMAAERGIKCPEAGGVTFFQRFGSALNLNVHFHTVALDGVFSVATTEPVFHHLPGPTDEEVAGIVEAVAHAVMCDLEKLGLLPAADGGEVRDSATLEGAFAGSDQLAAAAAASTVMRVAFGPRAGQKVRRLGRGFGWEEEAAVEKGKRCFSANGFTIHANRYVGMKERGALEKLLAYGARGAFCHRRLSRLDPAAEGGDLVYTLKTPWSDGTEAIVMSPAELMAKLVALIPPPYVHLSRYFGVFSSHSKWRRKIVLRPDVKKGFVAVAGSKVPARMSRSRLLARVFKIAISRCPSCGVKRRERWELVTDELLAARIQCALGLYGRAPARAPPRCQNLYENLSQRHPDND